LQKAWAGVTIISPTTYFILNAHSAKNKWVNQMPKLGKQEVRRPQLIESTLAMISKGAGVSVGIISHYFGGKYGLLEATMRSILKQLANGTRQRLSEVGKDDIHGRIKAILGGNFDSHQIDPKNCKSVVY
jgi:TetR/AcrR family transcriptional regulator, transcriptional repressor of bet genes